MNYNFRKDLALADPFGIKYVDEIANLLVNKANRDYGGIVIRDAGGLPANLVNSVIVNASSTSGIKHTMEGTIENLQATIRKLEEEAKFDSFRAELKTINSKFRDCVISDIVVTDNQITVSFRNHQLFFSIVAGKEPIKYDDIFVKYKPRMWVSRSEEKMQVTGDEIIEPDNDHKFIRIEWLENSAIIIATDQGNYAYTIELTNAVPTIQIHGLNGTKVGG